MSVEEISPVIITRDAAATIAVTLESLRDFPRVTVYDNGSTDETLEICRRFPNTRIEMGRFFGFGPTKNHAADLAETDWVLPIDADEYLSDELLATLRNVDLHDPNVAYRIERYNLFMGKHVVHGGWGNDWLVRLYHRKVCRYNDVPVHERVSVPDTARIERLDGALWHQAVTDIDQFLKKISYYSELRKNDGARTVAPAVIAIRAGWAFFKNYVLQRGFTDGWRGLVIANCNAQGTFFRHMKRYVTRSRSPPNP